MTLTLTYIHNNDTYYFPNKEVYVKRFMFLEADSAFLAHYLGLGFLDDASRDSLFLLLAKNSTRATYIELHFDDKDVTD